MVIALTRVDLDATLGTNDRGGPSRSRQDDFIVILSGGERNVIDIAGDNIAITSEAGTVLDDAVVFHPTADVVFIANGIFDTLKAFAYNPATHDVGAEIASVAHGVGTPNGLATNADGTVIFILGGTTPFVRSVTFNGSAFGSMVSPGSAPAASTTRKGQGQIAYCAATNRLAVATEAGDNGCLVYPMTGTTFGTPYGPSVDVVGFGVAWTKTGSHLALAIDNDPFVNVFADSGSALGSAIVPTTASPGAGAGVCVLFDENVQHLIVGGFGADGNKTLYAYPWSGSALGARIDATNPPASDVTGMALTIDNTRLLTWEGTEDLELYSTNLTVIVNPTVTSVTPDVGSVDGGETVVIAGTGFLAGAQVTFDGVAATGEVVDSSIQITCVTPAHAAGAVNVVVTNTDTGSGTLVGGYTYEENPPSGGLHLPNVESIPTLPHLGRNHALP